MSNLRTNVSQCSSQKLKRVKSSALLFVSSSLAAVKIQFRKLVSGCSLDIRKRNKRADMHKGKDWMQVT